MGKKRIMKFYVLKGGSVSNQKVIEFEYHGRTTPVTLCWSGKHQILSLSLSVVEVIDGQPQLMKYQEQNEQMNTVHIFDA